ncbi:MAG: helix-turn-helix domain-containing protein [Pirellulaceae bacterium]|jgi:DNA-binding IclR family transcriptional regulator|nr:helix-turn-helix domain-containing protein [Pirellulaceae bacterium]
MNIVSPVTCSPKQQKPASNKYAVPAVEQMLDIVEHLAQHDRPCGMTELARTLGISTNGVFRILRCLAQRGYAEADPAGGCRLGTKFFTLGRWLQARFDLRRRARPQLERSRRPCSPR